MVPELRAERRAREIRPHRAELGHATKATELSDFSVCTTWGIKGKNLCLLHVLRKRMEYPELKRAVREQREAFDASVVLIDDKGSGTQLIQELIQEGLHAVTRYQPQSDKIMRSRRCQWHRLSRQAKLCFAESMHAPTAMIENDFVRLPKRRHGSPNTCTS
jgi:predicted phage terminase large subunit-like protein